VVFAIRRSKALERIFNIDEFRHGVERMAPGHYLGSGYYEHWLDGLVRVLVEKGVLTREELDARAASLEGPPVAPPVAPAPTVSFMPSSTMRPPSGAPRYRVGDRVVTRSAHPVGHTRLPRYARGKPGVIHRLHGTHVFPDTNAHGLGEQPQPLYSVRFEARALWGDSAEPNHHVHLDLWESYLQPHP
jgi:nitrile hydratase